MAGARLSESKALPRLKPWAFPSGLRVRLVLADLPLLGSLLATIGEEPIKMCPLSRAPNAAGSRSSSSRDWLPTEGIKRGGSVLPLSPTRPDIMPRDIYGTPSGFAFLP